jgi:hypothetical protein
MTSNDLQSQSHLPNRSDFPVGWRWLASLVTFLVTSRNRRRTSRDERKRLVELERTIKILRDQQLKAREAGLIHKERIFNVGLYLLLMDRDFSFLKIEMVSTFDHWRLRYIARLMGLLTYEACDDLTSLLGKNFRQSLTAIELDDTAIQHFNGICQRLNEFRKKHHQLLYTEIRNLVGAHRAQDSLEFLNAIEAIDPIHVFKLGADFFGIVHLLTEFLARLLERKPFIMV